MRLSQKTCPQGCASNFLRPWAGSARGCPRTAVQRGLVPSAFRWERAWAQALRIAVKSDVPLAMRADARRMAGLVRVCGKGACLLYTSPAERLHVLVVDFRVRAPVGGKGPHDGERLGGVALVAEMCIRDRCSSSSGCCRRGGFSFPSCSWACI